MKAEFFSGYQSISKAGERSKYLNFEKEKYIPDLSSHGTISPNPNSKVNETNFA